MAQSLATDAQPLAAEAVAGRDPVPRAGWVQSAAVLAEVAVPTIAKGIIIRRRGAMALAERLNLDQRALRRLERLRANSGPGPVMISLPGRKIAFVLAPGDVGRVLENSPVPFATSTPEKRAALAHFEPKNSLLSEGAERVERRHYNEQVLETERPVHRMADRFLDIVATESARLRAQVTPRRQLDWDTFTDCWFRVVRRVIFGDAGQDDQELSSLTAQLRYDANWAFLRPKRRSLRTQLHERILGYVKRADSASLAGLMASSHSDSDIAPESQAAHWLFAFDAAGMTTFRTLALLTGNPEYARKVRQELADFSRIAAAPLPLSRAAILETVRLWPTSPLILREARATTEWSTGEMAAGTTLVIYAPYFHRNSMLPYADAFTPELWLDGEAKSEWPLIPFSEGPAACPGRNLVLLLGTAMIGSILSWTRIRLKKPHPRLSGSPLPATLNHFRLTFELAS